MTTPEAHREAGEIRRVLGNHPSGVLLVAQLVAVLLYPFLDDSTAGPGHRSAWCRWAWC